VSFQPFFRLTPRILRQLKAIEQTTGFLKAVRLRPEWIREVRSRTNVREALASLQIEGNSLTLERAFELAREIPRRELRDSEREFCNYLRAFEATDSLQGQRDAVLGQSDLLNLHRLLVGGVRGGRRGAGELRREDVKVGDIEDGKVVIHHHPPSWLQVESEVGTLLDWIEAGKMKGDGLEDPWVHPVIQAGIAQHRLVWIHPFVDGNGRTARMFTTLLLYQRGYDFKYLFELSSYYNRDRDAYYAALRSADASGDYTEWLTFFLGGFAYQMVDIQELARQGESQAA
jgi:Fic family protein